VTAAPSSLPRSQPVGARAASATIVTVVAFLLYRSTLLPGIDFGDTASFQAAIGELAISPRQAYPLYFAVGNVVSWIVGGEAAFALNLASAICGALACGVLAWVASTMTGSVLAGLVGGLLLASSYTFWTQSIIAEVYALHLLLLGLVLAALLRWERRQTVGRLTLVFALYALSFGNHLMTVLLAPAIVVFVGTAPGGLRQLLSPKTIALAAVCAFAGACQYLWNASYLWHLPDPPATAQAFLRTFWFDVTKSDWRETMVFGVHEAVLGRRVGMYMFDLRQQVGAPGIALALAGILWLLRRPRLALLTGTAWLAAFIFAFTYNVGDVHVFFLPSHQIVALWAAAGVAALEGTIALASGPRRTALLTVCGAAVIAYPAGRAWQTWPAVDRHDDRRPVEWLSGIARGLDQRDLLLDDVNWQIENGFDYYQRRLHPELNLVRATDVVLTLPFLVCDNLAAGREVLATPIARDLARAAYGDLFRFEPDSRVDARALAERIRGLPADTPYLLARLAPYPELPFDRQDLADASRWLTAGTAVLGHEPSYTVIAGLAGHAPLFDRRSDRPWQATAALGPLSVAIRMESWLPTDTIRRAGFGQVLVGRRHAMILERGVSFVAFSPDGSPVMATYASGLFAPIPRFRVTLAPSAAWPDPARACDRLSIRPWAPNATPSARLTVPGVGAARGAIGRARGASF
jgi:Protein O-mannosyl-transferase TMEM260-like